MKFICKLSAKILPNIKTKRPGLRMNNKMFVLGVFSYCIGMYFFTCIR